MKFATKAAVKWSADPHAYGLIVEPIHDSSGEFWLFVRLRFGTRDLSRFIQLW